MPLLLYDSVSLNVLERFSTNLSYVAILKICGIETKYGISVREAGGRQVEKVQTGQYL